jgi:hypothetical protein
VYASLDPHASKGKTSSLRERSCHRNTRSSYQSLDFSPLMWDEGAPTRDTRLFLAGLHTRGIFHTNRLPVANAIEAAVGGFQYTCDFITAQASGKISSENKNNLALQTYIDPRRFRSSTSSGRATAGGSCPRVAHSGISKSRNT